MTAPDRDLSWLDGDAQTSDLKAEITRRYGDTDLSWVDDIVSRLTGWDRPKRGASIKPEIMRRYHP